ncbi:LacI family DNA-binding transcriptional regulator [Aestuariimicrobium sp. T2.26MG-19.2B]|uniref:LacI family DNA-binding transcriptional regulator n=1 Tax=Aestuariimicrobium sp. T2.26MG-19.2B TaxID=3040679 RepID=UPI0024776C6E|nr:LacI family DNA-binding transcriptional regulator [Aestuariimicrobium sp. T2.26MG-19.2B]CAI9409593.1 Ribose operon repressor [Aestuariimicrobium sp. T2.26MG-19.2B]
MSSDHPGVLPTMKDVADRAGVSRQTVSLVMRGQPGPSDHSRERVLAAAKQLGYHANASARLLRQRRTGLIGVLYTSHNAFELRVVDRLLERAAEQGHLVALGPVTEKRTTEVVVTQLLERRVEALACYNPDPGSAALRAAIELMPVVWLGERTTVPGVDVVRTDDENGLQLVVDHLVELGHTRITYAGGQPAGVGSDRAAAYRSAMAAAGLTDHIDVVEVGFGEEDGAAAARVLLARSQRPTAVVTGSDQCAAGVLAVLARAGVSVPEDISVTGYDDSDVAARSYHQLTTVRQDVDLTVEAILDSITSRLDDPTRSPRDVATVATLQRRASTAAPHPRASTPTAPRTDES